MTIPDSKLGKYPTFPVEALESPEGFNRFIETMDWIIGEASSREQ